MSKDVFKLEGAEALNKIFSEFPDKVTVRSKKAGLGKAGRRLRTLIRRDAPRRTGTLRKAIKVKQHRGGSVTVGLKERFYYKKLDLMYPTGGEYHPWFLKSVERHSRGITRVIIEETKGALYVEAGKAYARSRSSYASVKGR